MKSTFTLNHSGETRLINIKAIYYLYKESGSDECQLKIYIIKIKNFTSFMNCKLSI